MAYPVAMETLTALPRDIWERTPPEAQAYIGTLEARVATLEDMVRTLQEQLNQSSRNSSRPPSSDPPQSQRPTRPRSKRRRGGQPGHPGQTRTLVPVEEVDEVVVLKPTQCSRCQAPLSGDDAAPFRHQVIEIPPIKPVITEYQWHQVTCPACGETTRAPAWWRAQWHLWSPGPRYGGIVHGSLSPIQTDNAADAGRGVRRADECRDNQSTGTSHDGSGRSPSRGSPHLRAPASGSPSR